MSAGLGDIPQFAQEFKKALKNMFGYFLLSLYLAPLAAGAAAARLLSFSFRLAERLIEVKLPGTEPEVKERVFGKDELIIPTTVLYEAFRILRKHGRYGREWIVALGYQEINGMNIVTHVHDTFCPVSLPASARADEGVISRILSFYERCGAKIAGFAHIHPWDARSVSPSAIDIKTHALWEELYDGKFIGIVFTNSGVFRIFHGRRCKFRPVIAGDGVRRIEGDLYALEA
ncbi:hypothetical protein [Ferroglobus sp.]|uniref:hypothetical protein n=1 Tax=Ferroglobus sp. TaxID=2614230 RepID=UPI0025BB930C|nr:hypothetical protein [Ferroglobus sp.]